jgi:hypothetical protein
MRYVTDEATGDSPAVVAEAIKKAAVVWVSAGAAPAVGLWCVPFEDSLLLVTGPGEQSAPFLADGTEATVRMRGDHGGHVVTWPASVTRVVPGTQLWDTAAPLVAGKRLNARGSTEQVVERWGRECLLLRLTPSAPPIEAGDGLPQDRQGAPPRPTPAARSARRPFRLHRVRRRR